MTTLEHVPPAECMPLIAVIAEVNLKRLSQQLHAIPQLNSLADDVAAVDQVALVRRLATTGLTDPDDFSRAEHLVLRLLGLMGAMRAGCTPAEVRPLLRDLNFELSAREVLNMFAKGGRHA